jgi:hypothetical protein
MQALTLDSTARKVSILHLIAGSSLGGRHRLATVSIIGNVSLYVGRCEPYILYSVRIDVDELLRDRELSSQPPTKVGMAKSKSTDTSHRKRKSDENDMPNPMKKAKVSTSAPDVAHPRVTIRLKLGPRPPELEPYPCCLCVSASRDDLLPVHDRPLAQHPAHADIKTWMAHENCARVLPETWLDEVETGPMLADGTRKREKMVFGVDAIVKDRWNLVSHVRPRGHCQFADRVDTQRNVHFVPRIAQRCTARQFNAPEENAPRHFTYPAHAMEQNTE